VPPHRFTPPVVALALCCATVARGQAQQGGAPAEAPPALTATPSFDGEVHVAADAPLALTLSRVPLPGEGRLAVVVGTTDLTALFERDGTRLRWTPRAFRLPAGDHELTLYLATADGRWQEVGRWPLKVLSRGGFAKASIDPALTVNNTGQIVAGQSGAAPPPARARFQDVGGTGGLQTTHVRGPWTVQSQLNLVGAGRRADALRFGERGDAASRIDLSDYLVRVERRGAVLALGHVSFGANRHLVNGFASRGLTASVGGTRATLAVAAMNGSSVVGWSNFSGLERDGHRVTAANLGLELLPDRPGGFRIDASLLDGSVRPVTGVSAGGIVDAETSDGMGVTLSASTPSQRLTVSGGLSSSRFLNAADPQLGGDTALVPLRAVRRQARFADVRAVLLQNRRLFGAVATSLSAAARHERVDPLFRSVAAPTQADLQQNVVEVTAAVDALQLQLAHTRTGDNLDRVASVLTTRGRISAVQLGVPLAQLLRVTTRAELLPTLAYGQHRTRQRGNGTPVNGDFRPVDIPDQSNVVHDASLQWQGARWRLAYRFNRSAQDNRQPGRETSDLVARTSALSLGVTARAGLELSVEGALERQENRELAQVGRVRRLGLGADWRITPRTALSGALSVTASDDEPRTSESDDVESRVELSRAFNLWANRAGDTRGRLFVRWGRQSADVLRVDPASGGGPETRAAWTLVSGVGLRLF
jgi:hypothetical protein